MGVWEFLTKERGLGQALFRWREPWIYRIRLRADLVRRLGLLLGAWAAATGVFCIIFAFNAKPPGLVWAFVLGAVFGLGPMWMLLFYRPASTSGRVTIDDEGIRRQRNYASLSFTGMWSEWADWPFAEMKKCVVVAAESTEQSFSVLLISIDGTLEIVGVPEKIDVRKLTKSLTSHGVSVSSGRTIPVQFRSPVPLPVVFVVSLIGVALFAGGIGTYLLKP